MEQNSTEEDVVCGGGDLEDVERSEPEGADEICEVPAGVFDGNGKLKLCEPE